MAEETTSTVEATGFGGVKSIVSTENNLDCPATFEAVHSPVG